MKIMKLLIIFFHYDYIFSGKNTDKYVETRARSYNNLITKTTQSILPDPESVKQHLQRRNLQCYQYKHCTERWLTQIDPYTLGWTTCAFVVQLTTVSR